MEDTKPLIGRAQPPMALRFLMLFFISMVCFGSYFSYDEITGFENNWTNQTDKWVRTQNPADRLRFRLESSKSLVRSDVSPPFSEAGDRVALASLTDTPFCIHIFFIFFPLGMYRNFRDST
jgi:hypothetical protein